MTVKALTAGWCGKCAQAKKDLEGYDIIWLDVDKDEEATYLKNKLNVEYLPFFILDDRPSFPRVTYSYKKVKEILDSEHR